MKLRIYLYNILVNRMPAIQKKYHSLRQQKKGAAGRLYAWAALCGMNIESLFYRKKYRDAFYNPDKEKRLPAGTSESALSKREAPKELAERLKQYDVISFDVFDTLVLRMFSAPADLFFAVGGKLNYPDFKHIRMRMEWRARQKAKKQTGLYEVTLEQIYEELEIQAGIPREYMQTEIETELKCCFGNPYMLEVFERLAGCGKTIVCTSDMYLPEKVIRQMVEKCGFTGISKYFISCEWGASKHGGGLFKKVKETYGAHKTYVHVGDHPAADVEWAKKSGFNAEFYQNVNIAGMPYRAEDMSVIPGAVYRGIVNAHIHNGLHAYSREYELGFIYGGLFVLGYCRWIHEYVQVHNIDKILFLARDGDILNQVYGMLYPDESGEGKTQYVYWSRLAAVKMGAGYFKYDYFRRFIDHKVNQGYTLEQIFTSMEIEDMLQNMCSGMGINREAKLTDKNAGLIREYLMSHWEEVLAHYEEQLAAGRLYYKKILSGCRRVAAVDVGWAGSGAVSLNHIVNAIWKLDCEVIGLLAGTNTIHNAEPHMSEPQLQNGRLVSYLYSQSHNRDIWKWHDAAQNHNLGVELFCCSCEGSLKGFYYRGKAGGSGKEPQYEIRLKQPDVEPQLVKEMQKGIKDFAEQVMLRFPDQDGLWKISGSDVYGVLKIFLKKNNYNHSMKAINSTGKRAGMELGI